MVETQRPLLKTARHPMSAGFTAPTSVGRKNGIVEYQHVMILLMIRHSGGQAIAFVWGEGKWDPLVS